MSFATILTVEGEQQILRAFRTTLIAQGYTVVAARVGDDALLRLVHNKPDLILLGTRPSGDNGSRALPRNSPRKRYTDHCSGGAEHRA